ncbi:Do family serine endopeptidase [Treponema sp.]
MNIHERFSSKSFFVFNLVLLGALFGFSLAFLSFSCSTPGAKKTAYAESSPSLAMPTEALAVAESLQTAFRSVSERVLPTVVELKVIEVKKQQVPRFNGVPWEFFFGNPDQGDQGSGPNEQEYKSQGLGSGIIVRKDGPTYYVLTNQHVAGEASEIIVAVRDGREFKAKLIGQDKRKDLALVSFESKDDFPIAILGDSDTAEVGDWAIAVGNPLGLMSSVTMGIVSAVGRNGGPGGNINDFIQTDAAINQGNSGGALVNIRGEVIGINTWIASPSGGSVGLGFAIPINNAKRALDDFISTGSVKYGWLGVSIIDIDKESAKDLGLEGKKGALVSQMFLNSPAEKSGMLPGDFVTAIDGKEIKSRDQLVLMVGDLRAGQKAVFTLIRDGKSRDITVKIEARTDEIAADNAKLWPGVIVVALNEDLKKAAKLDANAKGLFVADTIAKSAAAVVGVQRGDLIVSLNGTPVNDLASFYKTLNEKAQKEIWFELSRAGATLETPHFKR